MAGIPIQRAGNADDFVNLLVETVSDKKTKTFKVIENDIYN